MHFRFEGMAPKFAELNFRGSPLKHFLCTKSLWVQYVVMGAINAHLGVDGCLEPARSVSVKL